MLTSALHAHWWVLALRGLLAAIAGLVLLLFPSLSLLLLITLIAGYCLFDGILSLWAAARSSREEPRWWTLLLEGIVSLLAGIAALAVPGVTALVLLYIVATWAVVTGILEIVTAIRLRRQLTGEWALILGGVLSVLAGLYLFLRPEAGVIALGWVLGAYAFGFGILLAILAWRLRRHKGQLTAF